MKKLQISSRQSGKTSRLLSFVTQSLSTGWGVDDFIYITVNTIATKNIQRREDYPKGLKVISASSINNNVLIHKDKILLLDEFLYYDESVLSFLFQLNHFNFIYGESSLNFSVNLRTFVDFKMILDVVNIPIGSSILNTLKPIFKRFTDTEKQEIRTIMNNRFVLDGILSGDIKVDPHLKIYNDLEFMHNVINSGYPFYLAGESLAYEEKNDIYSFLQHNTSLNNFMDLLYPVVYNPTPRYKYETYHNIRHTRFT